MKNKWRLIFWFCFILLIVSNLFWLYKNIDSAVGRSYYEVSCNEYEKDRTLFKKIIESKQSKPEILQFLKENKVNFESFKKGTDYVISFNSFSVLFDSKGKLKNE